MVGHVAIAAHRAFGRFTARGGFAANFAFMLTGTVLGQAVSIALSPILTRVYAPDQFGFLSVYAGALTILGVIAALGYELAIPLTSSDRELANLSAVCVAALLGATLVLGLAVWFLPDTTLDRLWLGPLNQARLLLPIGFVCLGGYYIMIAIATRQSAFRDIASTRLSQGLTGPLSQIGLGVLGAGTPGLAIGYVIGQSSGTSLLIARMFKRSWIPISAISWDGMRRAARRYLHFPLYASWARLLDMAGSGPILFLLFSALYSGEIAGYMFLAERIIARPLFIVSTSLLQVFVGEMGQAVQGNPDRVRRRFHQIVPAQFLLAAVWILLANLVAGWVFPVLFGSRWTAAVPVLHASSLGYLALTVLHPVSTSLQLMERQALAVGWQAVRLAFVAGSVVVAWHIGGSPLTALWFASVVQLISCGAMLVLIKMTIERIQRT